MNRELRVWVRLAGVLSVLVTVLGLVLRVEHALTFDGPGRGADYAVNLHGVRWMLEHRRPFDFTEQVSVQVRYQPPIWYALGAVILKLTGQERPIAWLAVIGWLIRQLILARLLKEVIPNRPWSALVALSINALLPLSVLTDGKLNPEGLHTTIFMVAVYGLWRVEREAHTLNGVSTRAALLFGGFSGLAVLTKATAGVLPLAGAIVWAWQLWSVRTDVGSSAKRIQLLRSALVAGLSWVVVAGWWCGPNLLKYGHPFPHIWNLSKHLPDPVLYRRPLGWILPFTWREYLDFPIIYTDRIPRPELLGRPASWAVGPTSTTEASAA